MSSFLPRRLAVAPPGSPTDAVSAETPTCREPMENGGMEVRLGGYINK